MNYDFHPVANLFPMMSEKEFSELVSDIEEHGLREPIRVHEGRIVDGRNRYLACRELGIRPDMLPWDGKGSLVAFVISANLRRRHLEKGQAAAIAAEALPLFEREAEERRRELGRAAALRQHHPERVMEFIPQPTPQASSSSREQAGAAFGVNDRYVQDAKAVREADPELFEKVKSGEVKLPDAARAVRKEAEREERKATVEQLTLPPTGEVERADSLRHIPADSIDLILTDPPYNISDPNRVTKVGKGVIRADFDGDDDWDTQDRATYLAWLREQVREWARVLKPGGAVVTFMDRVIFSHLWDMCPEYGLTPKAHVTWIKRNAAPNGIMRRNLSSSTETLLWAVKPGASYLFNEVPGWDRRNFIETNIITAQEKVDHPNQKPLCVLTPLIQLTTNPGDLVLDPYAGSGSTGVASLRLGRRCHLIERDEHSVILARHRLAQENAT